MERESAITRRYFVRARAKRAIAAAEGRPLRRPRSDRPEAGEGQKSEELIASSPSHRRRLQRVFQEGETRSTRSDNSTISRNRSIRCPPDRVSVSDR